MKRLLLIFNISALLLMNACGNIPQDEAGNVAESVPSASSSSEAMVPPSAPTESISATSSIAEKTEENAVDENRTDIEEAQILYKDYFATEIQWQGTYLSGDEQYQLGSEAPYDTTETRYSYSVTPEGAVLRQRLKRDPDLGNWRSQSEEPLPTSLTGISEAVTPYSLPSSVSEGKLFLIQNETTLFQTDENGENPVKLYESSDKLSKLTAGEEIIFFIEGEKTLCRLHLASSIVDNLPLPDAGCSRYAPISNLVVQVYSPANDSYLLNFQTMDTRLVAAEDVDEMGRLRYEIKQ